MGSQSSPLYIVEMENKFKFFYNFSRKHEKSGVPEEVIGKNDQK
jgi:hypothetical protein